MKLKVTTGFGQDEKFTIEGNEAHKAYYLFNNPEKRGTFENGVAVIGKNIDSILPDWNATMGWNATHKLVDDDWNDIRSKGVDVKMGQLQNKAQKVAKLAEKNPALLEIKLDEAQKALPEYTGQDALAEEGKKLSDKMNVKNISQIG